MESKARILMPIIVVGLVVLVIVLDAKRRTAEQQLQQLSVQMEQVQGNTQQNRAMAKEILAKVQAHINLDMSVEPTVATIVDVAKLRAQNPFYNKAENGDYLIVTSTRAILFDPDTDRILDVVPVQINAAPAPDAAAEGAASSTEAL
jgi:hypothetical protein